MEPDQGAAALQTEPKRSADGDALVVHVAWTPSPAPDAGPPALSNADVDTARAYVEASRAASTRKAYRADWNCFSTWCRARGADPLPASPPLVAVYLAFLAER